jgi:NAD(P)-dependent dehydrogenase (short-subunit alcohol dehydrogenase family)
MGMLDGKVAFISGAARGEGRSHAVRFAEEGADLVAIDLCEQIDAVPYPLARSEDLKQTAKEVEALGRRIVARVADVRDAPGLLRVVSEAADALGPPTSSSLMRESPQPAAKRTPTECFAKSSMST